MRLAPEGNFIIYPLITILGIACVSSYLFGFEILLVPIVITSAILLFCLNFFRDPSRIIPKNKNLNSIYLTHFTLSMNVNLKKE